MSSIVSAVFEATIGLLVNKGRNLVAQKLKEGDVTDEQFRKFIVCEIDDIKSKLDGLARTNLLASVCFFKEGLVYLYKVLDLKTIEQDGKSTEHEAEGKEKNSNPGLQPSQDQEASVQTVSLANEMSRLQVKEQNDFTRKALSNAKDRFKRAREKATESFCNEALSTFDRILAMQYRVMATLLEEADNPTEALAACRLCLEELHSMPAVQKSFNVQLKKGLRSRFNKGERDEIICSVCRVNRVIFHVTQMVGGDVNLSLWPCVDIGEEKVDPLRDTRVTKSLQEQDMEHCLLQPCALVQAEQEAGAHFCITTNTQGQFIVGDSKLVLADTIKIEHYLKVFDRTGKHLYSYLLPLSVNEKRFEKCTIEDIATDGDCNVFLLVEWSQSKYFWGDSKIQYYSTVYIFDGQANLQHEFDLKEGYLGSLITVNGNGKVFVAVGIPHFEEVQVYDTNGLFLHSFGKGTLRNAVGMTATNSVDSGIMVLEGQNQCEHYVHMFSELGDNLSQFKVGIFEDSNHYYFSSIASHGASGNVFLLLTRRDNASRCNYPRMLCIFTKDSKFVRNIDLHTESLISADYELSGAVVTKEGLVAMYARDKTTKKRMIVVL